MSLEHILLGLLRDPASGYDLRREFARGPRQFWTAELSQIYPTLRRMEERGWLRSRNEQSRRGPARRVYRRTGAGTSALRRWLRGEPAVGADRLAYIGQLAFLSELGDLSRTARFVERLRKRFETALGPLEAEEAHLLAAGWLDDDAFHELLCVRIGVRALRGRVDACDEALKLVRARRSRGQGARGEA